MTALTEDRSYHRNGTSPPRETPPTTTRPAFSGRVVVGQSAPMARDQSQGARLQAQGPKGLSNTDLTALLLWSGQEGEDVFALASRMLAKLGGLAGLGRSSFAELRDAIPSGRGLSEAKACQIMAALELGRRAVSLAPEDRPTIQSPRDVANLLVSEMASLEQEHLRVLLLNTRNEVLSIQEIYIGNVNATVVRAAEVFRPAVRENAPAVIVVHNHPSGDPTPSAKDVTITRQLAQAGRLLGIELLDHVVVGRAGRYVSMNEKGLGFS
jgi:DNA repair protein RadC